MRVLATTLSVVLATACADDGTTVVQNSNAHDGDETEDSDNPCGPSDAPIVFAAMLDSQAATDLYVITAHGGPPTRLTSTPGAELWPAWSPDRSHVAFVRDAHLYVLDVDNGTERLVAQHVGRTREISGAAWSPDGTRLAYPYPRDPFPVDFGEDGIIDESYATTLHFVNADGTNDVAYDEPSDPSQPPGIGTLGQPAWSSTNLIAFTVSDDCPDCAGGKRYAYSRPDGTDYVEVQPLDLLAYPLYPSHDLDWSPDATRWVFTAMAAYPSDAPGVIATRSVTDPDDISQLTPTGARYPRYAPDGASIAFLRTDGIYVMHANGTGLHSILSATDVHSLDW